ncbi:MAG: hypothetical protein NZM38_07730 [Cytophagales bacterium]|nr:hypothetical protein [Cytophagales bacterium]MDW8384646.1 hypothetical protein [Flammeovirgaceae bacterium]
MKWLTNIFAISALIVSVELFPLWYHAIKRITFSENERKTVLNNGKIPTLNGFFIEPHHLFAENFYLYKVRAKRLLKHKWQNDILRPSLSKYKDLRSALSVLVLYPSVEWGNSILMELIILQMGFTFSVFLMYGALYKLFNDYRLAIFALFMIHLFTEGRVLREATTMWSYSLFVLLITVLNHSQINRSRRLVLLVWLLIFLIAGIDFRFLTFLFIFLSAYLAYLCFAHRIHFIKVIQWGSIWATAIVVWLVPNFVAQRYDSPDTIIRAGFLYPQFDAILELKIWLGFIIKYFFDEKFILLLGLGIFFFFKKSLKRTLQPLLVLAFFLVINLCISLVNRQQTYANYHYLLSVKILFIVQLLCNLQKLIEQHRKRLLLVQALTVMSLLYNVTINWFPLQLYKQMAVSQESEQLIQYLKSQNTNSKTLATLSFEYNYLLAYHTDLELLLPSGFPLHNGNSNYEIVAQFLGICDLLKVNVLPALEWCFPMEAYTAWQTKGKTYAQINMIPYLLLHCANIWQPFFIENVSFVQKWTHKATWIVNPVIKSLFEHSVSFSDCYSQKPDFILLEEISSFLGAQVPDGYQLVFKAQHLKLYRIISHSKK